MVRPRNTQALFRPRKLCSVCRHTFRTTPGTRPLSLSSKERMCLRRTEGVSGGAAKERRAAKQTPSDPHTRASLSCGPLKHAPTFVRSVARITALGANTFGLQERKKWAVAAAVGSSKLRSVIHTHVCTQPYFFSAMQIYRKNSSHQIFANCKYDDGVFCPTFFCTEPRRPPPPPCSSPRRCQGIWERYRCKLLSPAGE